MTDLKIAVIGAGVIGRTHIETLGRTEGMRLSAIVDPMEAGARLAEELGVAAFREPGDLLKAGVADAVVVATPNESHVPISTRFLDANIPVLLEKPVANTIEEGRQLEEAVARTGVPLLVGHHRRHNPIIKTAKKAIDNGDIGDLVTAVVNSTLTKPSDYFVAWRIAQGTGGPLLINMIHEIDLLRHMFGEVESVQAMTSNAKRGFQVEDTAACVLQFKRSGMATMSVSDAACGPWAWDVSAGENLKRFPAHDVFVHAYAGTRAGLSLPDLAFWKHPGTPDWTVKMDKSNLTYEESDCYINQMLHFGDLIRGKAEPLVSCRDGVANMEVVEAIKLSANTGRRVLLSEFSV